MSLQKRKGTRFETAVARYMAGELQEPSIERRALHGSRDMGDLYGISAHGWEGIAECKSHRSVTPALVEEWRRQTLDERDNADADFALLVVDVYRAPIARSGVHVTLRDLCRICQPLAVNHGWLDAADGTWVQMTLGECCAMMRGLSPDGRKS